MILLRYSLIYFSAVFGIAFGLGTVRVLGLEPTLGPRWAEFAEAPLLLATILVVSRWLAGRIPARSATQPIAVGILAALWVLGLDVLVGVQLRGMTISEVFLDRDPVAGPLYYFLLLIFALAPWGWSRALST